MPITGERKALMTIRKTLSVLMICMIVGLAPVSGSDPADNTKTETKLAHPEVARIPAKELVQLIESKADIVIVDTQAADGYEMWHIPSAVNVTYDPVADPMVRQLMLIALPMDKLIVIYCLCEEGTDSARMALELIDLGYSRENIKVLEGGLIEWDANDCPIIKQEMH
jgi:rhodanese-related sulfurtransferase